VAPAWTPPPGGMESPIAGDWSFRAAAGERTIGGRLRFWTERGRILGVYVAPDGRTTPLIDVALDNGKVSFGIVGSLGTWKLNGVLAGERMNGTFETISRVVPWEAIRGGASTSAAPAAPAATPTAPAR
jgi:hypothetical protein